MSGERGAAPVELAAGVALILVPTALLILSFGPWLERHSFVRVAAAEAARHVVVSGGDEAGAAQRVASMAANSGLDPASIRIGFCGGAPAGLGQPAASSCVGSGLFPDGAVTVRLEADVPLLVLPSFTLGGLVTAYEHTERVEPYRSLP